jgi:ABC-type tungstate transport system permease subunit
VLVAAAVLMLAPSLASAADPGTLNIVGTSDVSDSGLVPNLIKPAFQAAFPQYTLNYTGKATGTAINLAKTGSGSPSMLIVHAASLENQFINDGFSLNNQFGYALFTNDFVLAGSNGDPANILANDPHNIVKAFADIAAAGAADPTSVKFVSRGGTSTSSGTTVEERTIWQQVDQSGLLASNPNVAFCDVSTGDGGGELPVTPGTTLASGNGCPDSGEVNGTGTQPNDVPGWYVNNGDGSVSQAGNVQAGNTCTVGGGNNNCYVLTDRGTYDYLASGGTAAGGPSTITNLKIVTRDNSADAPGGATELTNYFHAYIINPNKPGEDVNLPAAQAFVSFVTSPAFQAQLKNYLANTGDTGGAPFKADASPTVTATPVATTAAGGKSVTVSGTVTNNEPNYAKISGQTVTISQLIGGLPVQVATGNTDANGNYSIPFVPAGNGSYQASTGQISQIELPALNPQYGDILSPGASDAFSLAVQSGASITSAVASTGGATVSGTVTPAPTDGNGVLNVLARPSNSTGAFTQAGTEKLLPGQGTFAVNATLKPGTYTVEATYADGSAVTGATSATQTVTVPSPTSTTTKPFSAGYKKLTVKNGKLTLSGTLSKKTGASGATVKLLALKTVKVSVKKAKKKSKKKKNKKNKKGTKKTKKAIVVHSSAVSFKQVGKATVKKGAKTFTIKAKLTRGFRWILQLQFTQKGQTTTYSKVRYLDVH